MVLEPARGIVCVEAHAHNAGTDSAPDIGISPDIHDRRPVVLVPTPQNEPLGLESLGKPSGLLLRLVLATPAHWSPGPVTAPRRPTRVVSGARVSPSAGPRRSDLAVEVVQPVLGSRDQLDCLPVRLAARRVAARPQLPAVGVLIEL